MIDDIGHTIATNPQALTLLGAILAATVAFVSFSFNYRATLRNQSDTQFFEALKRFGDASPALRNSAAGLLVQMAASGASRWWYEPERRRPYFTTTLNQFVTALALETEPVVITTIVQGLKQLTPLAPYTIISAVHDMNIAFQADLVRALASYCACAAQDSPESLSDAVARVASSTPYDANVLQTLIRREERPSSLFSPRSRRQSFSDIVESERLQLDSLQDDERVLLRREAVGRIAHCARRLNETAKILSRALRLVQARVALPVRSGGRNEVGPRRFSEIESWPIFLYGTFLVDADLSNLDLSNVMFSGAQLNGADLSGAQLGGYFHHAFLERANLQFASLALRDFAGASLEDARLYGALLSPRDGEESGIWCAADFSSSATGRIDKQLLLTLCGRDATARMLELGGDLITFLRWRTATLGDIKVHASVREFLEGAVADERGTEPEAPPLRARATMTAIAPSTILLCGLVAALIGTIALWLTGHREDASFFAMVALGCAMLVGWLRVAMPQWIWRRRFALYGSTGHGPAQRIRAALRALFGKWVTFTWSGHETGPPMSRILLSLLVGLGLVYWQGVRYLANSEVTRLAFAATGLCLAFDAVMNIRERIRRTRYPL